MDQISITPENIDQYIFQSEKLFILDFFAIWSQPCLMHRGFIMQTMNTEYAEKAHWGTVDIDMDAALGERFGIITIPTTLVFFNGQIYKQLIGVQDDTVLKRMIDDLNAQLKPTAITPATATPEAVRTPAPQPPETKSL
jgi:thioredoxin 1